MVKTVIGTYSGNLGNFFGFADLDSDGDRDLIFHEPLYISNGSASVRNTNRKFHYWDLENGVKVGQSSANDYTTWDALGNLRRNPVFVGDFNNDGNYSIVNHETPNINTAFLRAANSQTVMVNGTRWYDNYKVSDMDGDGDDDVVSINTSDNNLYLWKFQNGVGIGGHAIGSVSALGSNYTLVGAGDLDHDGDGDVLFQRNSDGALLGWKLNSNGNLVGSGGLSFDINLGTQSNATALGVDDLDGDGKDEVLFRDTSNNEIYTLDIQTTGVIVNSSELYLLPDSDTHLIGTGDFDGDGHDDHLLQKDDGMVLDVRMRNRSRVSSNYLSSSPLSRADWEVIDGGDFDGDGDDDVLYRNKHSGALGVWEMEDGTYQSDYTLSSGNFLNSVLLTGDINGDGTDDLIYHASDEKVYVLPVENRATVSGSLLTPNSLSKADWELIDGGDFDGDGDDDVIFQNKHTGAVGVWEIENSVVTRGYNLGTAVSLTDYDLIGAGDFDGNGIDDVLWQHSSDKIQSWNIGFDTTLV